MNLRRVESSAVLKCEFRWTNIQRDENEMLGTEGVRRTTGVPNISPKNIISDKNILFDFYRPSNLSCKNNSTGVLGEDDQYV